MTDYAVYYHYAVDGALLYVGCSVNPFARFSTHKCTKSWIKDVATMRVQWFATQEAALGFEASEIERLNPPYNVAGTDHVRVRPKQQNGHLIANWLRDNKMSVDEFSELSGVSSQILENLIANKTGTIARIGHKISSATRGCIHYASFYNPPSYVTASYEQVDSAA